jgi:predicted metalloenzyme YecM
MRTVSKQTNRSPENYQDYNNPLPFLEKVFGGLRIIELTPQNLLSLGCHGDHLTYRPTSPEAWAADRETLLKKGALSAEHQELERKITIITLVEPICYLGFEFNRVKLPQPKPTGKNYDPGWQEVQFHLRHDLANTTPYARGLRVANFTNACPIRARELFNLQGMHTSDNQLRDNPEVTLEVLTASGRTFGIGFHAVPYIQMIRPDVFG